MEDLKKHEELTEEELDKVAAGSTNTSSAVDKPVKPVKYLSIQMDQCIIS